MSLYYAPRLILLVKYSIISINMQNKLALVLSGGFVKGAAHISVAEEMYKRDYIPDIFVGTSIGAIFSVMLGLYDDPGLVKEISLRFVKQHVWPQLVAFDFFTKAGLLESRQTVKYFGLS